MDISFYKKDKRYVYDHDPGYGLSKFKFQLSHVFPLVRRPFENLTLMAPLDTYSVLKRTYDVEQCVSNRYNHSIEDWEQGGTQKVPCKELYARFPFVFRTSDRKGTNEILKINEKVIHSVYIPN